MQKKSRSNSVRVTRRTFAAGAGAAAFVAGAAPFNIVRAQGGRSKVGVILPLSGFEAGIGQDCQRTVDSRRRSSSRLVCRNSPSSTAILN